MPRTGRPRLETPRDQALYIRLTAAEQDAIRTYAVTHHLTITQTLIKGFEALTGTQSHKAGQESEP